VPAARRSVGVWPGSNNSSAYRLLRRSTRSLVLTDAGTALYRHARIVLDAVEHAEESVRRNR